MSNAANDKHTEEHHARYTESFVKLLDEYKTQVKNSSENKNKLKKDFFKVICVIMYTMIAAFIGTLACTLYILYTKDISLSVISGAITAIISSFVTMLTAILKLPQIIANYLFNKDEDNQMVEIIKSIQQYEIGLAKSNYEAVEKADEEKKANPDQNLEEYSVLPDTMPVKEESYTDEHSSEN